MSDPNRFTRSELEKYVWRMPDELAASIRGIKERMTGQTTYDLRQRNHEMVMAVRSMWLDLCEQLPAGIFGNTPAAVFDTALQDRIDIYRALQEPHGPGTGGTIAPQMVSDSLFEDAKQLVRIAAETQMGFGVNWDMLQSWRLLWAEIDVSA